MVPHRSTNRAVLWLTAQIGRDAVLSESYGRRHLSASKSGYMLQKLTCPKLKKKKKKKKFLAREAGQLAPQKTKRERERKKKKGGPPAVSPCPTVPKSKMTGPKVARVDEEERRKSPTKVEQICRTRAKPQQIVATRLLYCLQYPVPIQVVCKGFTPAHMMIAIRGRARRCISATTSEPT